MPYGNFTDDDHALVYEVLGLPEHGQTLVTTSLVHWPYSNTEIWNPTFSTGNMTTLTAQIDAKMTLVGTSMYARCQTLMALWDTIGSTSPMQLDRTTSGAGGKIVIDHELQRENIRQRLGNNIGVHVPKGGFLAEVGRTYGDSPGSLVGGPLGGQSNDR